jgi:hypothetical protein
MKTVMKFLVFALISLAATFGFALSVKAQETPVNYGLVGHDYAGVALGYTHHTSGPPRVLHTYEFVANRPTSPNWDAEFKYAYTTGNAAGVHSRLHEALMGATRYWTFEGVKPFLLGEVGWAMQKVGSAKSDSYIYFLGVGAELQVHRQVVLTPLAGYGDAPNLHDRGWNFGAKITYRLFKEWSAGFSASVDEDRNGEYKVSVNRHF